MITSRLLLLQGLPARASLLLRLGGSFFLGFVPFILVVGLLFGGIYLVRYCKPPPPIPPLKGRVKQSTHQSSMHVLVHTHSNIQPRLRSNPNVLRQPFPRPG